VAARRPGATTRPLHNPDLAEPAQPATSAAGQAGNQGSQTIATAGASHGLIRRSSRYRLARYVTGGSISGIGRHHEPRELAADPGSERHEAAFRDNAIDEAVLRDLKEDHLRELGLPLGARLKLLKAIAALPQEVEIQFPAGIAVAGSPADSAERRQVTVMFSDLVGSTALSTRMDPEDIRKLISAYQKCVAETIRRFGGFVASQSIWGDGVLIYFGYPQAHEDDAERAVRAGLELVVLCAHIQGNSHRTNSKFL